jgi:hypothetical protein
MDTELESWRSAWQDEPPSTAAIPADLRERVRRQSRFLRIMLASEILVTVVIGGGTAVLALRSSDADYVVLTLATWLFIAAAWTFAVVSRRGAWSPAALTTEAFLEISIRRARSGLAAATFGAGLYFVEIAFCLAWIYHHDHTLESLLWLQVSAITVVFLVFVLRYRRAKKRELGYLLNLRRT